MALVMLIAVSPVQSAQLEVGHGVSKGEVGLNKETNNA